MTLTAHAPTHDAETTAALLRHSAHLAVGEALDAMNECDWETAHDLLGYALVQMRSADGIDVDQFV